MKDILPVLLYCGMAVIGWFVSRLWEADKELRESLQKLREEIPEKFVLRVDYARDIEDVKEMLREIRLALSGKADKD